MIKWSATARKPDVSVGEQEEKHDRNDPKYISTNYFKYLSKKSKKTSKKLVMNIPFKKITISRYARNNLNYNFKFSLTF